MCFPVQPVNKRQCFVHVQIIDELSGRLEKRESQLLTVSKDKARLEEECDNLRE